MGSSNAHAISHKSGRLVATTLDIKDYGGQRGRFGASESGALKEEQRHRKDVGDNKGSAAYSARFPNQRSPSASAPTTYPTAQTTIAPLGTDTGENGDAPRSRTIVGCM